MYSGAHWNSHGKFDFRLGKVQLACARHARWLAALAAIDAQPTAALVPLARRRFSRRSTRRLRGRRVGVAASCTLAPLPSPALHSQGGGQTANRGVKLFTWNWSSLATAAVPPNRRCLDRADVTLCVLLDLQE